MKPHSQGAFPVTRRLSFLFAVLSAVPVAVLAQGPAPAPTQAPAAAPANPISASQAKMYTMLSDLVIAAAEKMPEENYSYKPTPDVRSFGQLVGHVADSQYFFCALAAGDTKPASDVEKSKTKKADLVAALKESVAYCGKAYAGMTDSKGSEMAKIEGMEFARLTVLSGNTAHDYEHYGNMATYMRLKGIVPPSSEKGGGTEK
jgi:uncharacterized damage-inducible protein DinB